MKINTKSTTIIAALAMATTGALALNQTQAQASTVATVHAGTIARLYTSTGNLVQNRALAASTPWLVGKISNIGGETMYQVSTNEYLRAADSSLSGDRASQENKLIGTADYTLTLYNTNTGTMANRALAKGSSWQIGKYYMNKAGQRFVQVSTYEYADAANMSFNRALPDPIRQDDFGASNTFRGTAFDPNDNTTGSTITTPDTNTPSDNNNSGSTSTATPDLAEIKSAIIASINTERQSRGLSPLTEDSRIDTIAAKRAQEISVNFSHTRPDGNNVYTELHDATGLSGQGENISGDLWDQLSEQSSTKLAQVIMDNFKGEGISTTWNHYSAIINPDATRIGVGVYVGSDGEVYSVQDYAG